MDGYFGTFDRKPNFLCPDHGNDGQAFVFLTNDLMTTALTRQEYESLRDGVMT